MKRILGTSNDPIVALLRVVTGIVFFAHGAQKMLGWFGGHGFSATMNAFTGMMHIPALFAFLAILAEFAGSLGLITGLLSRVAALGIAVNMVVAIAMVHGAHGLFMNWSGHQQGEGFEYHLLAIGLALVVLVHGAGKASLDALIARRLGQA